MNLINNRFLVLIIIILLLLSFGNVQAQDWEEDERNRGIEFLGAIIGDVVIGTLSAVVVTDITFGSLDELHDLGPGLVFFGTAYLAGGSIGAPLGTVLAGKIVHDEGSVLGAFAGGIIGTGLGLGCLAVMQSNHMPGEVAFPVFFLAPPVFSVVGYKLFPHKNESHSYIPKNFPAIGLTVLPEKYDNKISPKIGAKVTVRF